MLHPDCHRHVLVREDPLKKKDHRKIVLDFEFFYRYIVFHQPRAYKKSQSRILEGKRKNRIRNSITKLEYSVHIFEQKV